MKASKCRVCGAVEWNHVCRGAGSSESSPPILSPASSSTETVVVSEPRRSSSGRSAKPAVNSPATSVPAAGKPASSTRRARGGGFDRQAYQRELMRQRHLARLSDDALASEIASVRERLARLEAEQKRRKGNP